MKKEPHTNSYTCYIINFIDHVSSYFLQSSLHCSCFIFIVFSPHSISFVSPTTVHLLQIYFIWLYSYYMVIQPYCQFHFQSILSFEINDLRVSVDRFLILDSYSLLEAKLRWLYYSLSIYIKQEMQQH